MQNILIGANQELEVVSHEQETRNLRLEIDHLHKKLHHRVHVRGDQTPIKLRI